MKRIYFIVLLCITYTNVFSVNINLSNLKVCDMVSPLGIDVLPIFSWRTSSSERGFYQSAYEISVTSEDGTVVWNSGKVYSDKQNEILYKGENLASRTKYKWSVCVYDSLGNESQKSESEFETSFMNSSEWTAKWISSDKIPNSVMEIDIPSSVECRYIKLDATKLGLPASSDANYYYFQLSEFEAYQGSSNVALGASVTSNNDWEVELWKAAYLTDGKTVDNKCLGFTSHSFSNANQHVYVVIDLGIIRKIDKLILYPRQDACSTVSSQAANFPSSFTIQTSLDGTQYSSQYSATNLEAPKYSSSNAAVPYYGFNFNIPSEKTIRKARIYATALGVFKMTVNGEEITENKLEPGETDYEKTVLYSTYDVTNHLYNGRNTVISSVAGGIFNITPIANRYSKPELLNNGQSCFKSELFIDYTDGTSDHFITDSCWRYNQSPTIGSNWWGGEDYNATLECQGIENPGFDVSSWKKVNVITPTYTNKMQSYNSIGKLKARFYEPLKVVEQWNAVSVTKLSNGNFRVDFGKNFAGQYRFTLKGKQGQQIILTDGERLNSDGTFYKLPDYNYADTYTFKGDDEGESWGPCYMYHGFRYLDISGLSEEPKTSDFTALRIRNNIDFTGDFNTDNSLVNSIHNICRDAIQSNLYNTVTDCPQREKLGWLDVPNEMFFSITNNYDIHSLCKKIVSDCYDSQYADGHVPSTCPHYMTDWDDDPNWGGSFIFIPYRCYKNYGDVTLIDQYYERMKALVDYYSTRSSGYIMFGSSYSGLSDWGQSSCGITNQVPGEFTITTTYYYLLKAISEIATKLGKDSDAQKYENLSLNVKNAFNKKFYNEYQTGVYEYGNQSEYGMPLYYGLVESENENIVAERLALKVKNDNYKIKTGEIGLKPVLMSLAKYGYNDVVYKMVNQTDYPSYGYFVVSGCTTTPEYWDMSYSQNHCMMDHIEEWFYTELGGIKNNNIGYKDFTIKPWIPSDMNQMKTSIESVYGKIISSYEKAPAGGMMYSFRIPENSTATICLPIKNNEKLEEDGVDIKVGNGIKYCSYSDTLATVIVGSGVYKFTVGDVSDVDPAKEEVLWNNVHSTDQLVDGSLVKIQERDTCLHYKSYLGLWNEGRYVGYSSKYQPIKGNYISASMRSNAVPFTIENSSNLVIDGKETFSTMLRSPDYQLYVNALNSGGRLLSWETSGQQWGIDIKDGSMHLFRINSTSTRDGNYVFFLKNDMDSPICTYGVSADYAPTWCMYKRYNVIDSTNYILEKSVIGHDSIFYERSLGHDGRFETLVLPFSVNHENLPTDYTFYRFVNMTKCNNMMTLHVDTAYNLVAGEPYLVSYSGVNPSLIHKSFEFYGSIESIYTKDELLKGFYSVESVTDLKAKGKNLYTLKDDGTAFIKADESTSTDPFRAYILSDVESSIDKYLVSFNDVTDHVNSQYVCNKKMDSFVFTIDGGIISDDIQKVNGSILKKGLYIVGNRKYLKR